MRGRFILITNPADQDLVTNYIQRLHKQHGVGWWHWVDNVWLISDRLGQIASIGLRDEIRKIVGSEATILVFQVSEADWTAYAPKGSHDWFRESWDK